MKKITLAIAATMLTMSSYAQKINVTGTVVGQSDHEPLIGVTVQIPGTSIGAVTDLDGRFTLSVDKKCLIAFLHGRIQVTGCES